MRRLISCLTVPVLLFVALFAILLARGPGLQAISIGPSAPRATGLPGSDPIIDVETPEPTPMKRSAIRRPREPRLTVVVRGPAGQAEDVIIDGNAVTLVAIVDNPTMESIDGTVRFALQPYKAGVIPVATCRLQVGPGQRGTCSAPAAADGWAWQNGRRLARRRIYTALTSRIILSALTDVAVQPKPVVLVHGFNSNAAAWSAWTGPDGFLAVSGIPGFAVSDGQFGIEAMDTGDFARPRRPTKSLAENASILDRYIQAVRRATGAERIDLVAHSMGGLIARYYVQTFMPMLERPGLPAVPAVNQLYMIGTPNGGTTCAVPPASLGLYPPAATELTPAYVQHIFNPRINDARGVPFLVLAGDPIRDFTALVCTPVPTDVLVDVTSAIGAIPVAAQRMPVRHGQQTKSAAVFQAVFQSLSRGPGDYPIPLPASSAAPPTQVAGLQMTVVQSGTLSPAAPAVVSVPIDTADAVNFRLYAPGQDVTMSILMADGGRLSVETAKGQPGIEALTSQDPEATVTEALSVCRPVPGTWRAMLMPRPGPATDGGRFYALVAFLKSDLRLTAVAEPAIARPDRPVQLKATLTGPVKFETARVVATVREAKGQVVAQMPLFDDGVHQDGAAGDGLFAAAWDATTPGLYSITIEGSGQNADGNPFQRLAVVVVQIE